MSEPRCIAMSLLCLPLALCPEAMAQPQRANTPSPTSAPREIMNPYFAQPAWKLWYEDSEPVIINKPHFSGTFKPPAPGKRKYPIFSHGKNSTIPPLKIRSKPPASVAGFWDDCYMSLDRHHTRLRRPMGQFIDAGAQATARDVGTRFRLGVNFTSQSYAGRGRHIVDDLVSNLDVERNFFFANCVRGTPAHTSYKDTKPEKVTDLYDGLFGHCYQSVGQSGSEIHGLYKMMLAGGCMPRATKNLLKKNGAYACALLTIFKAALPYADAEGKPLPYANELRHRPAYSSSGNLGHPHYCGANLYYHGYDESQHVINMVQMARGLKVAPPVAIMKLLSLSVTKDGKKIIGDVVRDDRLKCVSLTNMRIWGGAGETLELRVDLTGSYDLQKLAISFVCLPLYPQQKNVSVKRDSPGIYRITVKHDPKLPKGRIPVICYVTNGSPVPSNPVFINFYWPGDNELDDYSHIQRDQNLYARSRGLKVLEVTDNLRPVVESGRIGDAIFCKPGQTVSIDLKAKDPEGYPVTVYRWSGEGGKVENNRFSMKIPDNVREKIYKLHFIFSDGTGGYSGRRLKLLVCPKQDPLPDRWQATSLGQASWISPVTIDAGTITFAGRRRDARARDIRGSFVYRVVSGNQDIMCRLDNSGRAEVALMVRDTLDDVSPIAMISVANGKVTSAIRSNVARWSLRKIAADEQLVASPRYLRMIRRGKRVAMYVSSDSKAWLQVKSGTVTLGTTYCAGVLYSGGSAGEKGFAGASCKWLEPAGSQLPIVTVKTASRTDRNGHYTGPLGISVSAAPKGVTYRYTTDNSEPTAASSQYKDVIKLDKPGRHVVRVRAFDGKQPGQTVVTVFTLARPTASKAPPAK